MGATNWALGSAVVALNSLKMQLGTVDGDEMALNFGLAPPPPSTADLGSPTTLHGLLDFLLTCFPVSSLLLLLKGSSSIEAQNHHHSSPLILHPSTTHLAISFSPAHKHSSSSSSQFRHYHEANLQVITN
ncbi:hypothetical protein M0R45_015891 [Rubus argutus]|uniref:Uncharacterized protein n=1 Tax=Rubus argutus TaxID=59490 RepID=A0AAW1XR00_RUBAR